MFAPEGMPDFHVWAELSARLLRRTAGDRMRIVRDANLPLSWPEVDGFWVQVLSDDIRAGSLDRLERYCTLCRKALTRGEPLPGPVDDLDARMIAGGMPATELSAVPAEGSDEAPVPAFARWFTPEREKPKAPRARQTRTLMRDDGPDDEAILTLALEWRHEDFAYLCAELDHAPDRTAEIWDRRGIASPSTQQKVMLRWQSLIEADPAMKKRHKQLVARFLRHFRRQS